MGAKFQEILDSDLLAIAALSTTPFGRGLLTLADAAAGRSTLGLVIGTDVQAHDADLDALAGLVSAADKLAYFTGSGTAALTTLSSFMRTLLDDADAPTARATLGLGSASLLDSDTDTALAANSDSRAATQKAVKAYIDGLLAASDAVVYKGAIDCSANPNYPAADAGHLYRVSVAGKIGGASGVNVEVGDTLLCNTDGTASGTQAAVGANWNVIQANLGGAVIGPASATDGAVAKFDGTTGKLLKDGVVLGTAATKDSGAAGAAGKVLNADDPTTTNTRTPTDDSVSKDKLDDTTVAVPLGVNQTGSVRRGSSAVAGAETTTSTTYVTLATPDQVANVVMPSAGLLWVYFRALFKLTGATNAGAAAIFVGGTQAAAVVQNAAAVSVNATSLAAASVHLAPVFTDPVQGMRAGSSAANDSPNLGSSPGFFGLGTNTLPAAVPIEAPAGTYTVDIRFHVNVTSGGTLTVQDRLLLVKAEAYA
jgi:hypothetical protein